MGVVTGNAVEKRQLCTFYLDKYFFGVDVLDVQEIIKHHEMTRVPLANAVIQGLINLRGQIVTAIDMRKRLGLPDRKDEDKLPINLIIKADDDSTTSLLVDEIGDVLEVSEADFEPAPDTVREEARHLIQGTYKLENRLLLVLDTAKTLACNGSGNGNGLSERQEPRTFPDPALGD